VTSLIAWLDTSADEQRQIRELIALFSQSESRDELGIGQIRDAFSDTLFPGTSVIQTRARYYLFVPWIFRAGARNGLSGPALHAWADRQERRLIESLRKAGATRGLIGRRAGPTVKIVPSAIYWSGLTRYRILTRDVGADQLLPLSRQFAEADELADRAGGDWDPTLPKAVQGFPDDVPSGFDLQAEEALWLKERILAAAPDTMLAQLLTRDSPPNPNSGSAWFDAAAADAPDTCRSVLNHAGMFSLCMHGAALLYNLLVAESYEKAGYDAIVGTVENYQQQLTDWAASCQDSASQLRGWDRAGMWNLVRQVNPRIASPTQLFVDAWLEATIAGDPTTAAANAGLRQLVSNREHTQKQAQSRLVNDKLLRTWSGASGSAALNYRWPVVRDLVTDIHEGLRRDARP
jgi:hypothetical protein